MYHMKGGPYEKGILVFALISLAFMVAYPVYGGGSEQEEINKKNVLGVL